MMDQEVERANRIVGGLLDYARVRNPALRPVDLAEVLSAALRECAPPTSLTVIRDFAEDVPPVMADRDQAQIVSRTSCVTPFRPWVTKAP